MFAWYASFEGDSSVFFFIHRSITPARERERESLVEKEFSSSKLRVSLLIYRRRSRGRFSPRCHSTSGGGQWFSLTPPSPL